jgi:hypothetical protein
MFAKNKNKNFPSSLNHHSTDLTDRSKQIFDFLFSLSSLQILIVGFVKVRTQLMWNECLF